MRKFIFLCWCLSLAFLGNNAKAQVTNLFFDINGTTTGSGVTGSGPYIWETASFWNTNALGTSPGVQSWFEGNFPEFSAGSDATGSYTVTANANHTVAGMLQRTSSGTVTINGTGVLSIANGFQGFFSSGLLVISNKLSGTGGIVSQSGQIFLNGNNDYSGGTTPGSGLINFNNNNSFGTGNFVMTSSGGALIVEGTSAINIPNNWTISLATTTINCVGNTAGVTYSGTILLGANTFNIGCGGSTANIDIFSGVISGTGGIGRSVGQSTAGIVKFTGANTYTGKTTLQTGTTYATTLNSVSTPAQQASSSFGVPSSAANGTIGIGGTTFAATLVYVGVGETTDRVIDLAGTTGGATIQNDGSGPIILTSALTASGAGAKTLTLQGSNTGANSIAKIVNSTLATSVTKSGAGTWTLAGANTYTGTTTLSSGGGLLNFGNASALSGGGAFVISGNSSFDNTTGSALTVANAFTLSGGSPTYVGSANNMTFNGAASISAANRTITVSANTLTLGAGISQDSAGRAFTKAGNGTLVLSGVNTYSGSTTISAGTLALGSSGSLANTAAITIAAGATLDLSAVSSYTLSTSNSLVANGSVSTATIKAGSTVSFGARPVALNFTPTTFTGDVSHPSLTVSQGALTLANNTITVTNAAATPLGAGTYLLVQVAGGVINGLPNATPVIRGAGLAAGNTAVISVSGGSVNLVVTATPSFSALTASQSISYGTGSISLSGVLSAAGPIYPAMGETITVTINGNAQTTTIGDNTGDFSILYNPSTIPVSGSAYTITYSYGGDASLNSANNTTTALTVNKAALSITANNQTKTYGHTVTTSGSTQFTSSPLQNGETIGTVTLAISGGGDTATASVAGSPYTITPSAATGGTFSAGNYNITYNTGTLTVNPLAVNLAGSRASDGSTDAAAGILTVANAVGSDTVSVALGSGTLAGSGLGAQAVSSFGTLALGNAGGQGNADGTGSAASFNLPSAVALDGSGNLYVADTANNAIREVTPAGVVTTLAFTGLNNPAGVAVDTTGNVFVTDTGNHKVVELSGGTQTTLAISGLKNPAGLAVDAAGDVFVADSGNNQIVELPFGGSQTTVAITGLHNPSAVAVDAAGDIFVTDTDNNQVVELPFGGSQTTVAFTGLSYPFGLALDSAGDIFVADKGNNRVVELSGGVQTTLVLTGLNANGPYGVAVDSTGDIFVTDSANNQIKEIPFGGSQTTLAGSVVAANYTMTGATGTVGIKAAASFANLTASQGVIYSTPSITLSGKVSGAGPTYPAVGETITVTINGNTQTTTINDSTGDFTINYNTSTFSVNAWMTITYSYAGNSSLTAASDTSTTLNVDQLAIVLTGTRPYDGTASAAYGILTVANAVGSDVVTVASGTASLAGANAGAQSIVGMGTLQLGGAAGGNYTITGGVGSVTITLLTPAFSNLTASQSATYGTASVTLNGTLSAAGPFYPAMGDTITVTINGNAQTTTISDNTGDFTINYNPSTIPAGGTGYTITYSYGGNNTSLGAASDTSTALTVTPAALTVTANNGTKTYGQTATFGAGLTAFTSSPLQNGETIGTVTITASGGTAATDPVGPYNLIPSAATGGTFNAANYNITYINGILAVGQASLSITANNDTKTYGQTVTYGAGSTAFTSSPLQNGETIGSVTITASGGTAATDPVGPYSLIPSAATGGTFTAANYNITYNNGTLAVGQAVLSITANDDSKIYGTILSYGPGSTAFTSSPLQNGETIGTVTLSSTGAAANASVAGSPYAIVPSAATGGTFSAANYNITYNNGALTVNPLAVVLTGTRYYDGTATAAASILSVANKVGSDDVNVASGSGTLAGSSVGAQAITTFGTLALGGTTAPNYTLAGASGSVTISAVPPFSITSESIDPTGTQFTMTWTSTPGVAYHVTGTADLTIPQSGWTTVPGTTVTAAGATTTVTFTIPTSPTTLSFFNVVSP